ncbi:type VI secretion system TssO [Chryseobacterium sp. MFBS3-17]|uniref:type VI secretion system TssO n=1 Tax=Chryseobacterium sp. MFBS3-17 TaxID=2886689 RepID=UPI001D0F1FD2|nr:type VI secretion system TssO [Chryseobacterium sp. MFBS3-17]MCC2590643.1 type VI secretion system transmembrane protein TssO [Chryseobacterium sp. MFBS3-17]
MEQIHITLSNKEKRHYFLYLLAMLFFAVLILSLILLAKFRSPFSDADLVSIQVLQEKAKFEDRQAKTIYVLDSAFSKIERLPLETRNTFEANEIQYSINDIPNVFETVNTTDPRKQSYVQIARFYEMFFRDKEMASKMNENMKFYKKQAEDCAIGVKEKKQQLLNRDNSMLMRP